MSSLVGEGHNSSAQEVIAHLEELSEQVAQELQAARTERIEALVIEQCQWTRRLAQVPLAEADQERLRRLRAAIEQQQLLLAQGLRVAGQFAERFAGQRRFDSAG
jgi:hypothetical protein